MNFEEWKNFKPGKWQEEIDVRNFIQLNYTPYEGTDELRRKNCISVLTNNKACAIIQSTQRGAHQSGLRGDLCGPDP